MYLQLRLLLLQILFRLLRPLSCKNPKPLVLQLQRFHLLPGLLQLYLSFLELSLNVFQVLQVNFFFQEVFIALKYLEVSGGLHEHLLRLGCHQRRSFLLVSGFELVLNFKKVEQNALNGSKRT